MTAIFALLSPRLLIALALCAVLAFTHAYTYRQGRDDVQAAWNLEKLAIEKFAKEAEIESRRIESARARNVIDAQNAASTRNARLQVDAGNSRSELERLRVEIARIDGLQLPGGACHADREHATTGNQLLAVCAAELTELAKAADGHASDKQTLIDAWPRD